jgi:phage gpG-like protein
MSGLNLGVVVTGREAAKRFIVEYDDQVRGSSAKKNFDAAIIMEKTWKNFLSGKSTRRRLGKRSGFLARSIKTVRKKDAAVVGTPAAYAAVHQTGGRTKARTIRPRTRKALRFFVGGQVVFARSVKHPGSVMPRRPHMTDSLKRAMPAIEKVYDGQLAEAAVAADRIVARIRRSQEKVGGR